MPNEDGFKEFTISNQLNDKLSTKNHKQFISQIEEEGTNEMSLKSQSQSS